MAITRDHSVREAYASSVQAPALFAAHGIRPAEKCQVVWDVTTLDEAEMWCHIQALNELISELNAAAVHTNDPVAADDARQPQHRH